MFLSCLFWGIWWLIAGHLPAIPDTLLYSPPANRQTIGLPAWLILPRWTDIPGFGLAAFIWLFSLASIGEASDQVINGDEEGFIFLGHLAIILCTLVAQLLNAGGRDWIGLTVHVPLTALALSTVFVVAYGFVAYFNRTKLGGLWLHLSLLAWHGLTLGIGIGLTGLGLVWPPLFGLAAGLLGAVAALVALLAAATVASLFWVLIRLALLLASPRVESERLKWRWWRLTGYDCDGLPPDGDWTLLLHEETFKAITGRKDWKAWRDEAVALCEAGALVMIQAKCPDGYGGRTATVMGKRRGQCGWVKVRLERPLPGQPQQAYFRVGGSEEDNYERDLKLLVRADGTPVHYDPLYPRGHRPVHLPEA